MERHALQCGFCTPDMIMAAIGLVERHRGILDGSLVREELDLLKASFSENELPIGALEGGAIEIDAFTTGCQISDLIRFVTT